MSLAHKYNGEIINGDALQLYEGLPVTTNKLPLSERKSIPHHLIGCIPLNESPWTVRQFHDRATQAVSNIRARGKLPILVGGTQYYIQSLLLSHSLVEEQLCKNSAFESQPNGWPKPNTSTEDMLQELRRLDPLIAQRWHPNDRRKIQRSLEICLRAGVPASTIYSSQSSIDVEDEEGRRDGEPSVHQSRDVLILWTHARSDMLNPRLDQRVDDMLALGLCDEAQSLYDRITEYEQQGIAIDQSQGICIAIGYKELLPLLRDATHSPSTKDEAIFRIKTATKQYAKRQTRWIRLKLLAAIRAARLEQNLFLLDASDILRWSSDVDQVAHDITRDFLKARELPDPRSLSALASEMLALQKRPERAARRCDVCHKTLMSDVEWTGHVKSKAHQAAMRPKIDWRALYPKTK